MSHTKETKVGKLSVITHNNYMTMMPERKVVGNSAVRKLEVRKTVEVKKELFILSGCVSGCASYKDF